MHGDTGPQIQRRCIYRGDTDTEDGDREIQRVQYIDTDEAQIHRDINKEDNTVNTDDK